MKVGPKSSLRPFLHRALQLSVFIEVHKCSLHQTKKLSVTQLQCMLKKLKTNLKYNNRKFK